jgi:thiol:disulfide interchange protein DsbA
MKYSSLRLLMVCVAALLLFSNVAQAQAGKPVPYQEGLHYFLIEGAPTKSDGTMQLEEAFSYLCTHCYTFEPYITSWKQRKPENVKFRRIPVVFGRGSWELYARGYVTAEMMNVPAEAHTALMDRIWKEKAIIRNLDELATFYSQFGLDKEKFISTSRSFAVDGMLRKDQSLVRTYGIRGTPSVVLNGKYRIAGSAAVGNYDVMFDIVDYLIELETSASQQTSAAAD